jgi:hypothetical protein
MNVIRNKVDSRIWHQVRSKVSYKVPFGVRNQVWNKVHTPVLNEIDEYLIQVHRQIYFQLGEKI